MSGRIYDLRTGAQIPSQPEAALELTRLNRDWLRLHDAVSGLRAESVLGTVEVDAGIAEPVLRCARHFEPVAHRRTERTKSESGQAALATIADVLLVSAVYEEGVDAEELANLSWADQSLFVNAYDVTRLRFVLTAQGWLLRSKPSDTMPQTIFKDRELVLTGDIAVDTARVSDDSMFAGLAPGLSQLISRAESIHPNDSLRDAVEVARKGLSQEGAKSLEVIAFGTEAIRAAFGGGATR